MAESLPIVRAVTSGDIAGLDSLRNLWREYAEYLQATLGPDHVCMTDFDRELDQLPTQCSLPDGALLLATFDQRSAGCVGLRKIDIADDAHACEIRRMWVRSEFRRHGVGSALLEAALGMAGNAGFSVMYLDTVPDKMPGAVRLYHATGFAECPRYNRNTAPGIAFFRRILSEQECGPEILKEN